MTMVIATFIAYLLAVLIIGAVTGRTLNLGDYALDGPRLRSWFTAMSAHASNVST